MVVVGLPSQPCNALVFRSAGRTLGRDFVRVGHHAMGAVQLTLFARREVLDRVKVRISCRCSLPWLRRRGVFANLVSGVVGPSSDESHRSATIDDFLAHESWKHPRHTPPFRRPAKDQQQQRKEFVSVLSYPPR